MKRTFFEGLGSIGLKGESAAHACDTKKHASKIRGVFLVIHRKRYQVNDTEAILAPIGPLFIEKILKPVKWLFLRLIHGIPCLQGLRIS